MKILNWGLLSTARINNMLIPPLKTSKRNRLVGIASRSLETAQAYAREHGIPKAYGSYEDMLADPEIDAIYNPLPNNMHAEWTIKAVQAGKHVLCEKPFALSLAEVDAVAAAAQKAGRVVTEAFMYRHHPKTLKVQELVSEGAIGQVVALQGCFTFSLIRPNDIRWQTETGGGSLWDVGCYPLSYSRMIAGRQPVEVYGSQILSASGVDQLFMAELRYPNGVLAQFYSGFVTPFHQKMEIRGVDGTIVDPLPFSCWEKCSFTLTTGKLKQEIKYKAQDLYLGEVDNLAAAVLDGDAPRLSLSETREDITTILALLESARTGKPVRL